MVIALASPRIATSVDDGLARIERLVGEGAGKGAHIVCFPEAYLPGLRGQDFDVLPWDGSAERHVLGAVQHSARTERIAIIISLEHVTEAGRQIVAFVIDREGAVQGAQHKVQLDPSEDRYYVPGAGRRVFDIDGLRFGISICHEGWRYPETVRWAARRGAHIVFHPQHTGSERQGVKLTEWGAAGNPYYEQAMRLRSIENTIWFASVNYALRYQEAATSLIHPSGRLQACLPYGEEGVLVHAIDPAEATGELARRYAPDRHDSDG